MTPTVSKLTAMLCVCTCYNDVSSLNAEVVDGDIPTSDPPPPSEVSSSDTSFSDSDERIESSKLDSEPL